VSNGTEIHPRGHGQSRGNAGTVRIGHGDPTIAVERSGLAEPTRCSLYRAVDGAMVARSRAVVHDATARPLDVVHRQVQHQLIPKRISVEFVRARMIRV